MLEFEVDGNICTITLNDKQKKNALSVEMMQALEALPARINSNEKIRLVIFTGYDDIFCAGGDTQSMRKRDGVFDCGTPFDAYQKYKNLVHLVPVALSRIDVPIIAAINGHAIGGGLDLAMMCDMRFAADTAKFATGFIKHGLIPGDGGAWFLQRVIGLARALDLALTGRVVDASEALKLGLVQSVIRRDVLLQEVKTYAQRVIQHPREALILTKKLYHFAERSSQEDVLQMSALAQSIAQMSEGHLELVKRAVKG